MAERERSGATGALIAWLIFCGAAVCAAFTGVFSSARHKSIFEIETAYRALLIAQVFFFVFLWPLFERKSNGLFGAVLRLLGLMLAAVPLVIIARLTQDLAWPDAVLSQLLIIIFGVGVAAAVRLPNSRAWYYPVMFLVAGGVPFVAYLFFELGRVGTGWAAAASPFWAALSAMDGARLPMLFHACVATALVIAAVICRRRLSASQ